MWQPGNEVRMGLQFRQFRNKVTGEVCHTPAGRYYRLGYKESAERSEPERMRPAQANGAAITQ